jgi:ATP-binding protein involved in chromosome partitioning
MSTNIPSLSVESVQAAMSNIAHPDQLINGVAPNIVDSKLVQEVTLDGSAVLVQLKFTYPAQTKHADLIQKIETTVLALEGVKAVSVQVKTEIASHAATGSGKVLPNIKNVIAVASGKGGVGKSTTAVNIALALVAEGATVGLLDADIYGPSQPMMTGTSGRPETLDGKSMEPKLNHGLQINSIGFMVSEDQAMVWRGPMASSALEQLITQTNWKALDYLIIDMPPGTGDIQLTLAQKIAVSGAVIVTTPQDIALIDARKGVRMFEKVGIPILGLVENMAVHICSNCGHTEHIFGQDGGRKMAEELGVSCLGSLPLDIKIRLQADSGTPTVAAEPNSVTSLLYGDIARQATLKIATTISQDSGPKFPTINISKAT